MTFTKPQQKKIEKHLKPYAEMPCPVCSSAKWDTLPYPGAIVAQQSASVNIYKTLQVIQQVCEDCGYVLQFDASKMGVEV